MSDTCTIDDVGPMPVLRPATVADVCDMVRRAADTDQPLFPLGGRTMLDLGLPPTRPGLALDLRSLDQVIDYPARDMTITVQAGITLGRLQELLRAENQRLPIDVPQADQATLGGTLAVNTSGSRRLGHGTLRDYVIGISVVNDRGQEVKAGGRVVKNVAGYDLCKLHVGALGTLGIISQVTLKLKPRPETHALVLLGVPGRPDDLLERLHRSATRPVCLDLLSRDAAGTLQRHFNVGDLPDSPWLVLVGFEDNRETVAWQVKQLQEELLAGDRLAVDIRLDAAADSLWQGLTEFPGRASALAFKANLLPHATAAFCAQAASDGLLLQAHAGNGIVIGQLDRVSSLEKTQALLKTLRATAATAQGNLIVRRSPSAWKASLTLWGEPRGDAGLMRSVRQQLDPRRLFNTGRFLV